MNDQKITVDVCEKCGGVYFDNRELEKCDESFENASEIFNFIKDKSFINVDRDKLRVCPVCGANMVKNHTNLRQEVEIDVCYSCGGKFLVCKD